GFEALRAVLLSLVSRANTRAPRSLARSETSRCPVACAASPYESVPAGSSSVSERPATGENRSPSTIRSYQNRPKSSPRLGVRALSTSLGTLRPAPGCQLRMHHHRPNWHRPRGLFSVAAWPDESLAHRHHWAPPAALQTSDGQPAV